jgi:hypothetical protein
MDDAWHHAAAVPLAGGTAKPWRDQHKEERFTLRIRPAGTGRGERCVSSASNGTMAEKTSRPGHDRLSTAMAISGANCTATSDRLPGGRQYELSGEPRRPTTVAEFTRAP